MCVCLYSVYATVTWSHVAIFVINHYLYVKNNCVLWFLLHTFILFHFHLLINLIFIIDYFCFCDSYLIIKYKGVLQGNAFLQLSHTFLVCVQLFQSLNFSNNNYYQCILLHLQQKKGNENLNVIFQSHGTFQWVKKRFSTHLLFLYFYTEWNLSVLDLMHYFSLIAVIFICHFIPAQIVSITSYRAKLNSTQAIIQLTVLTAFTNCNTTWQCIYLLPPAHPLYGAKFVVLFHPSHKIDNAV